MANFGLLRGYRQFVRQGDFGSTAREGYWCREEATAALSQQLYSNIYKVGKTGGPTQSPMLCHKVVTQHHALSHKIALVLAYYENPRDPFNSQLSVHGLGSIMVERLFDIDGFIIKGLDDDGVHEWKIVSGTNKVPEPLPIIKVAWATKRFDGDVILSQIGCVNKKRRLGCEPGTLLLLGAPMTKVFKRFGLFYVDYFFQYSGDPSRGWLKWNEKTKVRRGLRIARQVPVIDQTGAEVLDSNGDPVTSRVADFMFIDSSGRSTETFDAPLYPEIVFQHMPGLRW